MRGDLHRNCFYWFYSFPDVDVHHVLESCDVPVGDCLKTLELFAGHDNEDSKDAPNGGRHVIMKTRTIMPMTTMRMMTIRRLMTIIITIGMDDKDENDDNKSTMRL